MHDKPAPIWDLPIRLFHWSLPPLLIGAWVCEEFDFMSVHAWCGYTLLTLVLFRIMWGLVGSAHARFASFLRRPRAVLAYLRGGAARGEGHNPAGGWSVMAMLALLLIQPLTGLFNEDDVSFEGPLAHLGGGRFSAAAGEWHEWNFNLLLVLVVAHVSAILFYHRRGHHLLRPMLTGGRASQSVTTRPAWLALLVLLGCAGTVWLGLSLVPKPRVFL